MELIKMEWGVYKLCVILQLIFLLGWVCGVKVTELNVPAWADPRDTLLLGCVYDMGGEELNSVKWYKDESEFFRYTPLQQPHVITFPVAGVHLAPGPQPECHKATCKVQLTRLSTAHSSGVYKCEVSTEAPKFHRDFRSQNVTIAAIGRNPPKVEGLPGILSLGESIVVNCTAAPADPAPTLIWRINGAIFNAVGVVPQRVGLPDAQGLVTAWREMRFHPERRYFPGPDYVMRVTCEAISPPGVPVPPLSSPPALARLQQPPSSQQHNTIDNQKLHWLSSGKASIQNQPRGLAFVLVLVCWRFYKFCT